MLSDFGRTDGAALGRIDLVRIRRSEARAPCSGVARGVTRSARPMTCSKDRGASICNRPSKNRRQDTAASRRARARRHWGMTGSSSSSEIRASNSSSGAGPTVVVKPTRRVAHHPLSVRFNSATTVRPRKTRPRAKSWRSTHTLGQRPSCNLPSRCVRFSNPSLESPTPPTNGFTSGGLRRSPIGPDW